MPRKPKPKLLAVDLDGTLLDPQGLPHEADVRALRALNRKGVPVSILTGRLYSGTRASAELLGLKGPVGWVDGSHLVDAKTHVNVFHHGMRGSGSRLSAAALNQTQRQRWLFASRRWRSSASCPIVASRPALIDWRRVVKSAPETPASFGWSTTSASRSS